jgi:hypothetical protein
MRRIAFTLLPLLFVASCEQQPTAADAPPGPSLRAAEHFVFTGYADFDYPATLDCIGEGFHMSGSWATTEHHVVLPNGDFQLQWVVRLGDDWTFVGKTSGEVWDLLPGYNQVGVDRWNGVRWWFEAAHENLSWKNRLTGAVIYLPLRSRFVRNAAGEIKVDVWDIGDCRLRQ